MGFSLGGFLRQSLDPLDLTGQKKKAQAKGASLQTKADAELDLGSRIKALDERAAAAAEQDAIANYDAGPVIGAVGALQSSLGERKRGLRAGRDTSVAARAQPGRQQLASQAGLARRSIQGEGSRAASQRAGIQADKELGNQQVQAQALGEQLQTEQGVEQLETEFTSFFNELASNRFSREISGLTEQMNEYLSAQGAKIGYERLESEARQATLAMYGRFASALGQEIDRGDKSAGQNYSSGSVTSMPSIFNT